MAPPNTDVDELNSSILVLLLSSSRTYLSTDTFLPTNTDSIIDDTNPLAILHGMNFSGFPNHTIQLKVGAPAVLLRNLDPTIGLCNGIRLIIKRLDKKVVQAQILTGKNIGQIVTISRVELSPFAKDSPFASRRRQLPHKLGFTMTINKSQG